MSSCINDQLEKSLQIHEDFLINEILQSNSEVYKTVFDSLHSLYFRPCVEVVNELFSISDATCT